MICVLAGKHVSETDCPAVFSRSKGQGLLKSFKQISRHFLFVLDNHNIFGKKGIELDELLYCVKKNYKLFYSWGFKH